ncbi:acetyl/propionyl-CoA carboxylase subuit alpha [Tersicoccus solisilvae]|uniref:biotin carboxylase n=1 Tax=Tersicoccus solisilvae TaxID=1882339 RepID=A0ABQ1PLN9_9MICC|nr:biotin carboxylase N-terminal domain-containing protein [Tersicoccus solisilvae]GGC99307.1 acetyl/propionyl-CoA carboxylase subuit alpha [Tersicoccus solisilvae]
MTIESTLMSDAGTDRLFATVLVANRGEIACRVIATLHRLGIEAIAVYSEADAGARHVLEADRSVLIGPAAARLSYLDVDAVVRAAKDTGAQAIHPGYGFLSENPELADACERAGIVLIGPGKRALETMADKIRAKAHVAAHGVPVVPGVDDADLAEEAGAGVDDGHRDERLLAAADRIGYPLLVKPSAGGGGKGMVAVTEASALPGALATARRTAAAAFGDDTLLLERLITSPRHIEVQVLADDHGAVIHLGERECSLQRRHQKVIEEAPSPLISAATRAELGAAACRAAASVDYRGAGTVEFIVSADEPDRFHFLEMNTRLQVEHPVTEAVTGLDLVEEQVRIAAGLPLRLTQDDVTLTGHAVEARLYAEDPAAGFLPTAGTVLALSEPTGPGVRVDSSLLPGTVVGTDYDPMLAKIIAHGADRAQAFDRLAAALADTVVLGVGTNVDALQALVAHPAVRAGDLDTGLIDRSLDELTGWRPSDADVAGIAVALHADRGDTELGDEDGRAPSRLHRAGGTAGTRMAGPAWAGATGFRLGGRVDRLRLRDGDGTDRVVAVTQATPGPGTRPADAALVDGEPVTPTGPWRVVVAEDAVYAHGGAGAARAQPPTAERPTAHPHTVTLHRIDRAAALAAARARAVRAATGADPEVRTPMPGTVVAMLAETGTVVAAGAPLLVVEAMKMEHTLTAPVDGAATLCVTVGDRVAAGAVVAVIDAETETTPSEENTDD